MDKFFYAIIVFILLFFGYGIITKDTKKEKRISCQEKSVTFESIQNKKLIDEAKRLLESRNYIVKADIETSKYMKSKILQFISIKKANDYLENSIKPYLKENIESSKKLFIEYYIYENDKEDEAKKGSKGKFYEGYLVFEFKLDNKLIYKIQTDYMKKDTSDIPERMDCVIKSFITLKGE